MTNLFINPADVVALGSVFLFCIVIYLAFKDNDYDDEEQLQQFNTTNTPSNNPQLILEIVININPINTINMQALLVSILLIGVVSLINSVVKTKDKQEIGNSSKPNHQRVIRKTN